MTLPQNSVRWTKPGGGIFIDLAPGERLVCEPMVLAKPGTGYVAVINAAQARVYDNFGAVVAKYPKTSDAGWWRHDRVVLADNGFDADGAVPADELRQALKEGGNLLALQHIIQELLDEHDPEMREVRVPLTVKDLRALAQGVIPDVVKQGAKAGLDALK